MFGIWKLARCVTVVAVVLAGTISISLANDAPILDQGYLSNNSLVVQVKTNDLHGRSFTVRTVGRLTKIKMLMYLLIFSGTR